MDMKIFYDLLINAGLDKTKMGIKDETVFFSDPDYDTAENQAIVADVVLNYSTLEAEYLAAEVITDANNVVKSSLETIDGKAIRAVLEYLDPNSTAEEKALALTYLSQASASAKTERAKLA